jgi:hypothetical protein
MQACSMFANVVMIYEEKRENDYAQGTVYNY